MVLFGTQIFIIFLFFVTFYTGNGFPTNSVDLNNFERSLRNEIDAIPRNTISEEADNHFQEQVKKSDKPKYDPGWKFIGLGKRPEPEDDVEYTPMIEESKDGVNPLLGISTLINFEFFNAIKDGIEDAERETVKKGHFTDFRHNLSGEDDSDSLRHKNRMNLFGAKQKSLYDPGWMLTGLGK